MVQVDDLALALAGYLALLALSGLIALVYHFWTLGGEVDAP